ncbi:RND transporter [Nostoc sp. 'Peltigera membranacea cyanobiont' 213]|uniref:efflux RND transporter permease subunit n=1 Tax=Nostoc cyanobionts TaxID=3123326 RepID=UPI000B9532DB|nr:MULTISPECIES: efflux RND transporter permease subunit [unclassified Nostoc]AVH64188.1 acriflavin resistance protein [Nostoc sp. 'Peltigera membranacea cyanobiont' N6]OYD92801.1 RND transporter [Nostoc sp. 'Peltigera membranacea cyanobiont' 213]
MWIVKIALRLPYTFAIAALMIVILGVITIFSTAVDIFPAINIPVVSIVWTYTGTTSEEMAERIVTISERAMTTTVSDIEHIESQSLSGVSVVKVFFQPSVNIASAVAQITSVSQTILRPLPPGITPPFIIQYNASSVPIIQMSVSSKSLPEQALNDYATNFVRTQLATVQGASVPLPYGGKARQIMVDIDPQAMLAKGISAQDVTNAVSAQNLVLPAGGMKIGTREFAVQINNSPDVVEALNDLPIKQVNGNVTYIRDVAQVRDGFGVQANIVRQNGRRSSLLSILKSGSASTIEIVDRVKKALPRIQSTLPPELNLAFLFDQSLFVKASIQGVLKEGLIAAVLTALMILIFLGSWRSTVIVAVSIPLSMLVSIIVMSRLGQTFNIMTLGGLSLAVGILVDDATVEIENIHRNLGQGKAIKRAILDGAQQIATPAFVATLCICIVFVPVVFLSGVAKYLFVPLAMAVVFGMLASYVLSRTVVPTMASYLLPYEAHLHRESEDRNGHGDRHTEALDDNGNGHENHQTTATTTNKKDWIWQQHEKFNRVFEKFRSWYYNVLTSALNYRRIVFVLFGAFIVSAGVLLPFVGQDFFPQVDGGQFSLHVRALPGTRLEETERIVSQVENVIRQTVPKENLSIILDNIGLPNSGINLTYGYNGATIGPADADILVSLKESGSTFSYVKQLRQKLKATFPSYTFFFEPADIVTQILNFGLPAAVDVQISGPLKNSKGNFEIAKQIEARMTRVPGAVDVHMQQVVDAPELHLDVDRTEAQQLGMTQRDVANSVLTSLSSSGQAAINQWLDPKKGVSYTLAVQVPQYKIDSIDSLKNMPVGNGQTAPQLLGNLATVRRDRVMQVVNHYNIQPVFDIYANSSGRDLGGVARDVNRIIADYQKKLPRGSQINIRGQVQTMNSSFLGLGLGLVFAIVLVYCLMVVNFQSWLDPLIIMMALPSALAGIVWMLFVTGTTFSVPSLMGAIMSIGVATSNSILMIAFANEQRLEGQNAYQAAQAAGYTRLRPVLMTALAMLIGMVPMSLGLGEGGEQNAPLGRAVIGGLSAATVATLIFVPVVYSIFRRQQPRPIEDDDDLNFSDPHTAYSLSSSQGKS